MFWINALAFLFLFFPQMSKLSHFLGSKHSVHLWLKFLKFKIEFLDHFHSLIGLVCLLVLFILFFFLNGFACWFFLPFRLLIC
jgi:hypothetical protein